MIITKIIDKPDYLDEYGSDLVCNLIIDIINENVVCEEDFGYDNYIDDLNNTYELILQHNPERDYDYNTLMVSTTEAIRDIIHDNNDFLRNINRAYPYADVLNVKEINNINKYLINIQVPQ